MKNLTKIFMAVVVAMAAYACASDPTKDLDYQLGNLTESGSNSEGQNSLTISIEESRTQLGEKVDGLYPVSWCEEDVISVNGTISNSITMLNEENTAANFGFASTITPPYHVVYPASEATAVTEGYSPVTFLSSQAYTEGSFCEGAAPMCGYAEGSLVEMKHLTAVLRFLVKGANTLTSITVTAEDGKIAGNFDVDCKTGALVAHENATNEITVTFGENGLALTENEVPVYVAVPASESSDYGTVSVKLRSAEGNMTVSFNSSNKPLTAGKVREFKTPIVFVPNAEGEESEVFEIASDVDMKTFAQKIENNSFYPCTTARVIAEVNMSGVEDWAPIEKFDGFTFDGGNHAIKGLKAPLFGTVEGSTIKNVKLTDVAVTETERTKVGSLVCYATNSTISNCSAEGALTYNNTTYAVAAKNGISGTEMCIAGLAGCLVDSNASDCTNKVDITIESFYASVDTQFYPQLGGVFGFVGSSTTPTSVENLVSVSKCTNLGNITCKYTTTNNKQASPAIGGVIGCCKYVNVSNLTNGDKDKYDTKGNITFTGTTFYSNWGGVIGYTNELYAEKLYNYGKISSPKKLSWNQVGGVIGSSSKGNAIESTIKEAKNYGTVEALGTASSLYLGGVVGRVQLISASVTECENHGAVTAASVCSQYYHVGGVIGDSGSESKAAVSKCKNLANLTSTGYSTGNEAKYAPCIGGVVGLLDNANTTIEECSNGKYDQAPYNVIVTANKSAKKNFYIGGVVGKHNGTKLSTCNNHSNISLTGATLVAPFVGGISGCVENDNLEISGCKNYNNTDTDDSHISITLGASDAWLTSESAVYVGGLFGQIKKCSKFTTSENNCAMVLNIQNAKQPYIGGVTGGMTVENEIDQLKNGSRGDIRVSGHALAENFGVCGITNNIASGTAIPVTNCSNAGDIYCDIVNGNAAGTDSEGNEVAAAGGNIYICGLAWVGTNMRSISNFTNSGNITFNGEVKNSGKDINVSGALYNTAAFSYTGINNTGTLTIGADAVTTNVARIGGIARTISTGTFTSCVNEGQIIYEAADVKAVLLGGITGDLTGAATFSGCYNSGHIQFNGAATSTNAAEVCVGGAIGKFKVENGTAKNLVNKGSVTVGGTWKFNPSVGGVIGYASDNGAIIEECHNGDSTNNTHTVKLTASKDGYVGGIVGNFIGKEIKNCTSYGTVTAEGAANTITHMVGGIVGQLIGKATTADNVTAYTEVKLTSCVNHANVSLTGSIKNPYVGGVVGYVPNTEAVLSGCANGAESNASPATVSINATTVAAEPYLGGVVGYYNGASVTSCNNHANVLLAGNGGTTPYVGGIVGFVFSGAKVINNCDNFNNTDTDKKYISVSYTATSTGALNMGGIVGKSGASGDLKNCDNKCAITFAGITGAASFIGGIGGTCSTTGGSIDAGTGFYNNHNRGKLTATKNSSNTPLAAAIGLAGMVSGSLNAVAKCSNAGAIYCDIDSTASIYLTGISWYGGAKNHNDFINTGNITFNGTGKDVMMIGGPYNNSDSGNTTYTKIVNRGNLIVEEAANISGTFQMGGIICQLKKVASGKSFTLEQCENSGNFYYKATQENVVNMGGLAPYTNGGNIDNRISFGTTGFKNSGNFYCTGKASSLYIGGVLGKVSHGVIFDNAYVFSTIEAVGYSNVGMIMGKSYDDTTKATNCHVGGTIDKGRQKNSIDPITGEETYIWVSDSKGLSKENYFQYIYSGAITAAKAVEDGCGYISAIDATPVYATVE